MTPRRLSSTSTNFYKRIFPSIVFGFLVMISLVLLWGVIIDGSVHPVFLLHPLGMVGFGYLLMKDLVLDLMDEVWDEGEELLVKNNHTKICIPLSSIINISNMYSYPPRVTLTLREVSSFGKELTFVPIVNGSGFLVKPTIVQELMERIEMERTGNS